MAIIGNTLSALAFMQAGKPNAARSVLALARVTLGELQVMVERQ